MLAGLRVAQKIEKRAGFGGLAAALQMESVVVFLAAEHADHLGMTEPPAVVLGEGVDLYLAIHVQDEQASFQAAAGRQGVFIEQLRVPAGELLGETGRHLAHGGRLRIDLGLKQIIAHQIDKRRGDNIKSHAQNQQESD